MYAIVETGAKQYKVQAGDVLNIEKLDGKVGDKVKLHTIFVSDGNKIIVDEKSASATVVEAEIVEQFKDKKVIVFKFKKRKNYQRKVGHRQQLTKVRILSVGDEKAPAKKVASKKATKSATKTVVADEKKESAKKATKAAPKKETTATKKSTTEKKTATKKDDNKKTSAKSSDKAATKTTATKKEAPKNAEKSEDK